VAEQIAALLAITGGSLDHVPIGRIGEAEAALRETTIAQNADLCGRIESGDKLTSDDRKALLDTAGKATASMKEETSHAND
jgi:F-type H+-transporting ATPase subunit alpha